MSGCNFALALTPVLLYRVVITEDPITKLTSRLGDTFTLDDAVRAAQSDPDVSLPDVLDLFRRPNGPVDTGRRRCAATPLGGQKLYRTRDRARA